MHASYMPHLHLSDKRERQDSDLPTVTDYAVPDKGGNNYPQCSLQGEIQPL